MNILTLSPAEKIIRIWLGGMAAAELVTREARYPQLVELGRMSRDAAEADIAAWRAIAPLFAEGSVETGLSWSDLAHAARIQFATLCRSCDADPSDAAKRERRDAVQAILARLEWQREQIMAQPIEQGRVAA